MILVITLLSIVTLLFWGLSDYFAGRSGRKLNIFVANFVLQTSGLLIITPIVILNGLSITTFDATIIFFACILFVIAYTSYIKALSIGPMGVAAPIGNSYSAITLVLSLFLFGVVLSSEIIFALILIIIGVVLLSSDKTIIKGKFLYSKTAFLASIAMFAWGIGFAVQNVVIDRNEWYEVLFPTSLSMSIISGVFLLYKVPEKTKEAFKLFSKINRTALFSGLLLTTGSTAFYLAASKEGNLVIPAVITSASPLITSLVANIIDKEKLSLMNRVGAVVVVLGLVLLNI